MKKLVLVLGVLVLLLAIPVAAQEKKAEREVTLTADGKLYVSLLPDDHKNSPNAILMDHIGHQVEAKGFVRAKGGIQGIMIKSVAMAKKEKK